MFLIVVVSLLLAVIFLILGFLWYRRRTSHRSVIISDRKVITIAANHILLDSDWNLDKKTRLALSLLTKRACVFLFVQVDDGNEEQSRKPNLIRQFNGLVPANQILFCQTAIGRAVMATQLESVVHLDFDPTVLHQMASDRKTVLIAPGMTPKYAGWHADTLKEFVTSGNTDFFNLLH